ncbi:GNAT family N-acetyltransferase [Pseudoalteromonas phenolica]|uniref:GNAT family N-acetyltransferase n=1 Tax=Pseudoalteromonas phenolica TaxID=161398 RepID=A0A5R9Q528_9GAMM|nr:GNAT family N-acetyltransferase [Pseudoalteromonas phenolica]TLX47477.1 GNAT family N-acetyltransferase [Pseudoalteromonas phenolica]
MALYLSTQRLNLIELNAEAVFDNALIAAIPSILTETVVASLPPYFHGVRNTAEAKSWLSQMRSESRLFLIKDKGDACLGFVFVSNTDKAEKHIGYLLAQEYWGKGLASELLHAFIKRAEQIESWRSLVGGVDKGNLASANLLLKLGFIPQENEHENVEFFEYVLNKGSLNSV